MALLLSRRYLIALVPTTVLTAFAVGIPTDVLPNPWFSRMTPVGPLDAILWPLTSIAIGAVLATYALPGRRPRPLRAGAAGGVLSALAVGCPTCNQLVVTALGVSGALTYFAPIQPALGALSIAVAGLALRRRLIGLAGCPARAPAA